MIRKSAVELKIEDFIMVKITAQLVVSTVLLLAPTYAAELSAKQRVEAALRPFAMSGLETLRITAFSISNVDGPAVTTYKYDFAKDAHFNQTVNIGTQHRGILREESHQGDKSYYWYIRQDSQVRSFPAGMFKHMKAISPSLYQSKIIKAKLIKNINLENTSLSVIQVQSKYGEAYVLLDKNDQLRGSAFYDSQSQIFNEYVVCSAVVVKGYKFLNLCHVYNRELEVVYSSRLVSVDINPKFTTKDWELNVVETESIDGSNPYGLNIVPSNDFELTGALVTPPVLRGAALKAGLGFGDEIIAVNGKNVTKMVFSEIEAMFWGSKKLTLKIKTKQGATKTAVLAIK